MLAGIACRVDAGCTAEGVDLEACVVGEAVGMRPFPHPLSLLQRVSLQRVGRLGYLALQACLRQSDDLHEAFQRGAHLLYLVLVVCSKYQSFHAFTGFLIIIDSATLTTRMPRMTASEASVSICQWKNSPPIIFTPMKHSRAPRP